MTQDAGHLHDVTLANGLRVVAAVDAAAPLVEIRLSVPCAAGDETEVAVAQVLADLLVRPVEHVTTANDVVWAVTGLECARDIDRLGVFGCVPADSLPQVLRELGRRLVTARYTMAAITEARTRLVSSIDMARKDVRRIALAALLRRWSRPATPLRDLPPPHALRTVRPEEVSSLHRTGLSPAGATLVMVGDIRGPVEELAEDALGEWRREGRRQRGPGLLAYPRIPGCTLVHRRASAQAELLMAAPGVARTAAERPALDIVNTAFGGGVASRLTANVREDRGLAYLAGSALETLSGLPVFVVRVASAEENTGHVLEQIDTELEKMMRVPLSAAEIASAKRFLAGHVATTQVSPGGRATFLANLLADGADPWWESGYRERLASVGVDEVAAVIAGMSPRRFEVVAVGDADTLEATVSPLRPGLTRRYEEVDEVLPEPSPARGAVGGRLPGGEGAPA